ncbi:MAG: hypothetical protein EOP47_05825 [Sphingobacteriaceae bacterium]|nr:MAG: hypothetical protein EOP47_05825 [Sphingobacteriaceae bacterium]
MYRVVTYYSLKGLVNFVDLSDFAYGEWIIYDNRIPKYYVNIFNKESVSDSIILSLIESKVETVQSLIEKINKKENTKLSLGNKPTIEIIKKTELVNLDLKPLPERWVKNI